jgi:peptide/nickel transport system permease protein
MDSNETQNHTEKQGNRLTKLWGSISIVFESPIATVGLFIVLFWVFVAIFAPVLTPYTPTEQDWRFTNREPSLTPYAVKDYKRLQKYQELAEAGEDIPSKYEDLAYISKVERNFENTDYEYYKNRHPLGTDELGRDIWARLIYGAQVVLVILPLPENLPDWFPEWINWIPGGTALWGVFMSLLIGAALGLLAGYRGGWIDEFIMRILDAMMSIPLILLYLIIMAALGASAVNVVLAIAIVGTPGIARLVRSLALDIKTREYIRAAQTRGENIAYIMFREILPNARGPIIIDAMLRVGYAIFAMGTLGFLGLGMPPPSPDWGSMVAKGRDFILAGSPWQSLWPALAIAVLVVGLNLLADGIREESLKYQ